MSWQRRNSTSGRRAAASVVGKDNLRAGPKWYLVIMTSLLYVCGLSVIGASKPDKEALAVVNGDTVFTTDIDGLILERHAQGAMQTDASFDYRKLLNRVVNDRLIQQEARSLGMDEEEWLTQELHRQKSKHAARLFAQQWFKPDLEASDAEIRRYFDEFYRKFQVRTVSVSTDEGAAAVIAAIQSGAKMDSIAEAISLDSRRFRGGLHSLKHFADVEIEYRNEVIRLKVGEIAQPIRFREVFTVMRLEQALPADTVELPAFENRIQEILKAGKNEAAWRKFLDSLSAHYPLKWDDEKVESIERDSTKLFTPDFVVGTQEIIVDAGETVVTDSVFRSEISRAAMSAGTDPFDSILSRTTQEITDRMTLASAAAANGYFDSLKVVETVRKSLDSALVQIYLAEMVASQIVFNRQEFKEFYESHLEDFREGEEFQLARITANDKAVIEEAEKRLNGGASFDFVQKQYDTTTSQQKPPLEWITLDLFPDNIRTDISALKPGGFTQSYPTTDGWIIFSLKNRRLGRQMAIEEVDMQLREIMFQKKFAEILDRNLEALKEHSEILLFENNIIKYFED